MAITVGVGLVPRRVRFKARLPRSGGREQRTLQRLARGAEVNSEMLASGRGHEAAAKRRRGDPTEHGHGPFLP